MQQQTKKPVATSTVLITIVFLSIFIVMPPLCRVLYPKEDNKVSEEVPVDESEGDLPGLTCTKEYATIGISLSSKSSHSNGEIIANELMASIIEMSSGEADPKEQEEYNNLFASIIKGFDSSKISKTETTAQFTLDKTSTSFITQNPNAGLQWKSKEELRTYYEGLGFSCSDTDNTVEEVATPDEAPVEDAATEQTTPDVPAVPETSTVPDVTATPANPNAAAPGGQNEPTTGEPK